MIKKLHITNEKQIILTSHIHWYLTSTIIDEQSLDKQHIFLSLFFY